MRPYLNIFQKMANCSCNSLTAVAANCGAGAASIVQDIRIGCRADITETLSPLSGQPTQTNAYVSDINPVVPSAQPFFQVVQSKKGGDLLGDSWTIEQDDASIITDTREFIFTIVVRTAEQERMLETLVGQDLYIVYQTKNINATAPYRRFIGTCVNISGSITEGFAITIRIIDGSIEETPKFVDAGGFVATQTLINGLTA